MISSIHIRHFTLVDELALELDAGMTVLTGETGAGKSILLDALDLTLGGRAETGLIRNGHDRAEINVEFQLKDAKDATDWLQANELWDEEEPGRCLIRRSIQRSGPSKAFINDRPVSVQSLKALGELLVDIHGQHAHQSLLKRDLQRQALDDYAHLDTDVRSLAKAYDELKILKDQQRELTQHAQERADRLELLSYQVQELADLALQPGEVAELDAEQRKLANITQIQQDGEKACYQLKDADQDALLAHLNTLVASLETHMELDPELGSIYQQLNEAQIQIEEAATELRHYLDGLSLVGERLQWIDDRLATVLSLSRKHRVEAEQLPALQLRLQQELDQLQSSSVEAGQLEQRIAAAKKTYLQLASSLSQKRAQAAAALSKDVTKNMRYLGMKQGRFEIALEPLDGLHRAGLERIEFLVSTNPGHAMGALTKIASGGELSRISLAIQVVTAKTGRIPCLVFDEVDVGIGGGTAEVVGRLMRSLARDRQILCVTHQPQVASLAQHHLHVSKQSKGDNTTTQVTPLQAEQRTDEIARMLGGIDITEQTLSHAKEMLFRSHEEELPA